MADDNKRTFGKLIGIILVILIINSIGGYIIGKKVLIPYIYKTDDLSESNEVKETTSQSKDQSNLPGILLPLEAINLNPKDSAGEIFSCELTLEAKDQKIIDELGNRNSQIKDIILTYLRNKTSQELNDVSKIDQYKRDLIDGKNSVLTSGTIINLYIGQWITTYD